MNKTWNILAERAASASDEALGALNRAKSKVAQLQASVDHVETLRNDYLERYRSQQRQAHMIADTISFRRFLEHLDGLKRRVDGQMEAAQLDLANAKNAWAKAERERAKMESMVEREARNQQLVRARREQREIDAAGLTLYNLRLASE